MVESSQRRVKDRFEDWEWSRWDGLVARWSATVTEDKRGREWEEVSQQQMEGWGYCKCVDRVVLGPDVLTSSPSLLAGDGLGLLSLTVSLPAGQAARLLGCQAARLSSRQAAKSYLGEEPGQPWKFEALPSR